MALLKHVNLTTPTIGNKPHQPRAGIVYSKHQFGVKSTVLSKKAGMPGENFA